MHETAKAGQGRKIGLGLGLVAGLALTGSAAAAPEYIDDPKLGVLFGAAATLIGYGIGKWWDYKQALNNLNLRWSEFFTDGPGGPASTSTDIRLLDHGPISLLNPENSPITFERVRWRDVRPLREWCTDNMAGTIWLMSGHAGTGKTRLAMTVGDRLGSLELDAWEVGWLWGSGVDAIQLASRWHRPVLVIIDDAEMRSDLSETLLSLHRAPGNQTVHILLISREFNAWWAQLQRGLPFKVPVAECRTDLGTVGIDVYEQEQVTKRAVTGFSDQYGVDESLIEVEGIGPHMPISMLHAAALEGVLQALGRGDSHVSISGVLGSLLQREKAHWAQSFESRCLVAPPNIIVENLQDLLVLGSLVGARDDQSAERVIRRVPGLEETTPQQCGALIAWSRIYRTTHGYELRPRLPSLFLEFMTADSVVKRPDFAIALIEAAFEAGREGQILTLLVRSSGLISASLDALQVLLCYAPARLLPVAIKFADLPHRIPDETIAKAIRSASISWEDLRSLHQMIPAESQFLMNTRIALADSLARQAGNLLERVESLDMRVTALRLSGHLQRAAEDASEVVHLRSRLDDGEAEKRAALARALTGLSTVVREQGRYQEAIKRGSEAISTWRAIRGDSPEYTEDFTNSLIVQANALGESGNHSQAAELAREAVGASVPLLDGPHGFVAVEAILVLGKRLQAAGLNHEADSVTRQSVAIYRALAQVATDYERFLADALHVHASVLVSLSKENPGIPDILAEAANLIQEAVHIWRTLNERNPGAYVAFLAEAYLEQAIVLFEDRRPAESARAASSARNIYSTFGDVGDHPRHSANIAVCIQLLSAIEEVHGIKVERPS